MNPGKIEHDADWIEALRSGLAASGVPRDGMLVFVEDRRDVVVELGDRFDGPRVDCSASRGLSARAPLDTGRMAYLADARPDDVTPLIRSALDPESDLPARSSRSEGLEIGGRLPVEPATHFLAAVAQQVRAHRSGLAVRARWVGFEQRVRIGRSARTVVEDRRKGGRIRVEASLERGDGRSFAVVEAVVDPEAAGIEERGRSLAQRLIARVETRLGARELCSGAFPVVLGPGVGGVLVHEIVGHALEADTLGDGASWLGKGPGDRGRQVGSKGLLIVDDPRRGRASWRLDDEGEPARPTPLVQDGRVAGCLHDQRSAQRFGVPCSGHGRRSSFREPVHPRMGCTFVAAGRFHPEEALEGIARGIYVRRMEAASIDTRSGRAVFRVSDADEIRDGRLAAPLVAHLMHVEAVETLRNIECVASDLEFDTCVGSCVHHGQPLAISVGAPTLRLGATRVQF